jgi:hypothetical protein
MRVRALLLSLSLIYLLAPAEAQTVTNVTAESETGARLETVEFSDGGARSWQIRPEPDQREFFITLHVDPAVTGGSTFSSGTSNDGVRIIRAGRFSGPNRWVVPVRADAQNTLAIDIPILLDGNLRESVRLLVARPPFGNATAACDGPRTFIGQQMAPVTLPLGRRIVNPGEVGPTSHTAVNPQSAITGAVVVDDPTAGWSVRFAPTALGSHDIQVTLQTPQMYYERDSGAVVGRRTQSVCVPITIGVDEPKRTTIRSSGVGGTTLQHLYAGDRRDGVIVEVHGAGVIDLPGTRLLIINGGGDILAELDNVQLMDQGAKRRADLRVIGDPELLLRSPSAYLVTPGDRSLRRFQIDTQFHPLPSVTGVSVRPLDPGANQEPRSGEVWKNGKFRLSLQGSGLGNHVELVPSVGAPFARRERVPGSSTEWEVEMSALNAVNAIMLELQDRNGRRIPAGQLKVINNPTPAPLQGFFSVNQTPVTRSMTILRGKNLSDMVIQFQAPAAPYGTQHINLVLKLQPEGFQASKPEITIPIRIGNQGWSESLSRLVDSGDRDLLDRPGTNVELVAVHDAAVHGAVEDTARVPIARTGTLWAFNVDGVGGAAFWKGQKPWRPITGAGLSVEGIPMNDKAAPSWFAGHGGVAYVSYAQSSAPANASAPAANEPSKDTGAADGSFLAYGGGTIRLPMLGKRSIFDLRMSVGWLFSENKPILLFHPGLELFSIKR